MNTNIERLDMIGILPVVSIPDPEKAVATAQAVAAGGLPAIEVTFRNVHAAESIRRIHEAEPDIFLGAGTVLTKEQADLALDNGAAFLVTPSFNEQVIVHVLKRGGTIIPGCASPSEVEKAMQLGLDTVKIFPAESLGGAQFIKALSGPYSNMRFLPTGGINVNNMVSYLGQKQVVACGGSWLAPKTLIDAGDFSVISAMCNEAVATMLGYEMRHIGINNPGAEEAKIVAERFVEVFGIPISKEGKGAIFVGTYAEVLKKMFLGDNGHIAMATNCIHRAIYQMERNGVKINHDSAVYSPGTGEMIAIYLEDEIGGFAVHLLQK